MSSKRSTRIVIGVIIILIGIQFIRPSHKVPKVDPNGGFLALAAPTPEMARLVKNACYDCHSYETQYPWYSNIAPVSWWISSHVNDGRKHLNFSDWGKYPYRKRIEKAKDAAEEVSEGHMPFPNYVWMHGGARLTNAQRAALVDYFEEVQNALGTIPPMPKEAIPTQ